MEYLGKVDEADIFKKVCNLDNINISLRDSAKNLNLHWQLVNRIRFLVNYAPVEIIEKVLNNEWTIRNAHLKCQNYLKNVPNIKPNLNVILAQKYKE